jgi:hypothetical protein
MTTTTLNLNAPGYFARRTWFDWLFAVLVVAGGGYAFQRYAGSMDGYEKAILAGAVPLAIWLSWFWRPLRGLGLVVGALTLLAISLYAGVTDDFGADLAQGEQRFLLKYFLSSQSAILWMCVLFFMSTVFYWIGFFGRDGAGTAARLGSRLAWAGAGRLAGALVREPPDRAGHRPHPGEQPL